MTKTISDGNTCLDQCKKEGKRRKKENIKLTIKLKEQSVILTTSFYDKNWKIYIKKS